MEHMTWGVLLVAAALLALGLLTWNWRRGRLTSLQYGAGLVPRLGFLFLGITYVSGMVDRHPRLPLAGLFVVGLGIFLNLLANTVERVRRDRAE